MFNQNTYSYAGMFATALRWVAGWTYFSAFWRRLIIDNKLIRDEAGYIGEKFNHFLPNALGIKPIIEYLVLNPDVLWWAMVIFTLVEAIVGLFLILGLFTRLASIGMLFLAMGILLGSGWIGTTCLDEWQIGVLGVASGFSLFFVGGGRFSLDEFFIRKNKSFTHKKWFSWLASGELKLKENRIPKIVLTGSLLIFGLTLYTNQVFHGGVFGTLHNKSVRPHLEISEAKIIDNKLTFKIYRTEGADVYGSFLIGIQLNDKDGETLFELNHEQLSKLKQAQIENDYVAKIKPGKHSLIVPLGAKAKMQLPLNDLKIENNETYLLKLTDISGLSWQTEIKK